jgi:hypothetical protein
MLTHPVGFFGASGYEANAVRFDGSNDYLNRGADLTSNADSKLGIISFWYKFAGGDGSLMRIWTSHDGPSDVALQKGTDNKFKFLLQGASASYLDLRSSTAYTADGTWHHLMAAWDVGNAVSYLYVDGSDDKDEVLNIDGTIEYVKTDHQMGANQSGASKIDWEVADFYFNTAETIDLSSASNRLKFRSAAGKPVDLGIDDGSKPTGSQPIVYFANPTATWHTNLGFGGGFTESGELTDAADSPSG